jgi:plastocyanin
MKRILSLLALVAMVAVTVFAVVAHAGQAVTPTKVTVTAKGFKFTLSRRSAPHGKVTFRLVNKGPLAHDFKIAGKKTPVIKKGKSASITVTLKRGKTYSYLCTVPGHAAAGMKGKFRAT